LAVPDIETRRKVAIIGKRVAQVLFGKEDSLGKYITIKGVMFQVVGIFDAVGFGSNERDTEQIYIPLTTLQRTFSQGEYIGSLNVIVDPDVPVPVVQEKATDLLKRRHIVAPDDNRAIGSWDSSKEFQQLQALFR
jgi:putative ABC transport system permease protein